MPTHVLYVDDSGTKEYTPPGKPYAANNSRHFVFGGALIATDEASRLSQKIGNQKTSIFGTAQVEIKSNWLRMPVERERRYLKPYALSEENLKTFVEGYYSLICESDLMLLAAVVDKVHMRDKYGENAWYPPAIAYEALLQRAQNALQGTGEFSVVIDDMTGKTPAQNDYKENLKRQHARLKQRGSSLIQGFAFDALAGRPKFVSSESNLVQVADIVAYNVMRQFRDHGEEWETRGLTNLPTYDWFRRICGKFRQGPNGRIQGYGVVKLPLIDRVTWSLKERNGAAP
jgi:hypothetical protein